MKKTIDIHQSIDKSLYQHQSLKRSPQQKPQQLNLLTLIPQQEDSPAYPLQITSIPHEDRLKSDWCCKLIHYESDLKLGGQFTYDEAQEILETTKYWDFTLIKDRIPRCRSRLLLLLGRVCSDRSSSNKQEVTT
jgi:hypothetical protein